MLTETAPPRVRPVPPAERSPAGERITSIDVLRGLTILVMIFVNDVAGVVGVPGWMKHIEPPDADGMTFVDVVFPAFLVIVGMSIPLALERRMARESKWTTLGHVLLRTVSLLVIGVFMVNSGGASASGLLPRDVWILLMYAGVILVWLAPPKRWALSEAARRGLRWAGAALLVLMAVLYRGPGEPALVELRTSWWGILGLIGWAYLVAACVYLVLRRNLAALIGAVALLYLVFVADAAGHFAQLTWITERVAIGSMLGSHAALTLSGVLLGVVLLPGSPVASPGARLRWAMGCGAFFAAAGYLLHAAAAVHPMFIINKIAATPAWCLWSAALTLWLWALLYGLLDVRRSTRWSGLLEASGQNALLAYLLAPIAYSLFALVAHLLSVPNYFALLAGSFAGGLVRSVLFAFAVVWAAAALRRKGFVLKL